MRRFIVFLALGASACRAPLTDKDPSKDPFSDPDGEDTAPGVDTGPDVDTHDSGLAVDTGTDTVDTDADTEETDVDTVPVDTAAEPDTGGGDTGGDPDTELVVADSVADYSGTQGADDWYYGYVEPSTSLDWVEMEHFLEGVTTPGWYADPSQYWTSIADDAAHPNGLITSEGRSPMEQWAVRRWVSDQEGLLHVYSHLAKNYEDGTTNGIDARLEVDGVLVTSWRIQGWDDVGVDDVIDIVVRPGSIVDFVLDPHEAEDLSDRTTWTIVITK